MDINFLFSALSLFFFVCVSAFFSSSEIAFTAVSRIKVHAMRSRGVKGASLLLSLLENKSRLLVAILIGNNVGNVAVSSLATAFILSFLESYGVVNIPTVLVVATSVTSLVLLVFGEITPKFLVLKHPEKWALLFAKPISWIMILFYPLIESLQGIIFIVSKILRVQMGDMGQVLTADEIKSMATLGKEEGVLEQEEQEMIHSIIEFSNTIVREIMTPRTDAVCIDVQATVTEAIALITDKGHSRIPVYEEAIDNIIGVLYAKDLLKVETALRQQSIRPYLRETEFIPEFKAIEVLFHEMRRGKLHIAIVLDEHGGFAGLVTMEDIIEEIIGDIQDEFDHEESPEFDEISPNHFVVDAKINIDDLGEKLGVQFPENEDYDTVGGFVLEAFGKFPMKGEHVSYQNLLITVKDIKKRRILKVEIVKEVPSPTESMLSS